MLGPVCAFTFFSTRNLGVAILDFGDASLPGKVRFTHPPWGGPPLPGHYSNDQMVGRVLEINSFIGAVPHRIISEVALIDSVPTTF